MTVREFRKHPEYHTSIEKIKSYRQGFQFTLNYETIPTAKANALKILMSDAIDKGYLKSIGMTLNLQGTITGETFERI